jgi:hypothetical protein
LAFYKENVMAKERVTFSTIVNGWIQLLTALAANAAEFTHLDGQRTRLQSMLDRARELLAQHDLHTAGKQQAAKDLAAVLAEGRKLATFLRAGVKDRYGNRNEKLVEFGFQPFRRRRRDFGEIKSPAPAPAASEPSNG